MTRSDASPATTAGPASQDGRSSRPVLVAASVGFFVIVLDTTVVNVALPSIGAELHTTIAGLQWVVDAYVIVFAAVLLSTGALSDRVGASRCFRVGLAGFVTASLLCGLAPSLAVLVVARVLQGAAAAAVLPASLALVRQAFDTPERRIRAIAIWTATGGAAVAAGPLLGGALTSAIGWRAIFFVNLPVGLLGITALLRATPSHPLSSPTDAAGQAAAVVALGALSVAIIEGGREGFAAFLPLSSAVLFVATAAAFAWIERHVSQPMVPLGLFRSSTVTVTTLTGFVLNFAFYGQVFVLSFYFQQVLRHSPAAAGLMFLPMTVLVTGVNLLGGRLAMRFGPKIPLVIGQLVLAAGLLGLLAVDKNTTSVTTELLLIPLGVGGGLTIPPLTSALMDAVPTERGDLAAGVLNAARQLGGALGVAINGALIAGSFIGGMHAAALIGAVATLASSVLVAACLRPKPPR